MSNPAHDTTCQAATGTLDAGDTQGPYRGDTRKSG